MRNKFAILAACTALVPVSALAAESNIFTLGEVNASAPAPDSSEIGGSTVTQDDIKQFNRESLDRAIDLVPGASVSNVGGRNERDVWIRGFDRWRVPLTIDGIRVYLPADNRVDFGMFTTSDIAKIQVSKGFTSVIDGPGAMGGSINLVSRKVVKPLESDVRLGAGFDQNGAFNGFLTDAFAGTRQDKWYVQGSITESDQTHYRLSDDYVATTAETGGNRDHSYREDLKVNIKAGFEPSPFDEYSMNFISQTGSKDNAFPDIPGATARNWSWPSWDKQSLYWLSKTGLDDKGSYIKVKAFADRFFNALYTWDNANLNTQATTAASSASWNAVLEVLEPRRAPTRVDLTVSYRTPEEVLDFAAPTLRSSASGSLGLAMYAPAPPIAAAGSAFNSNGPIRSIVLASFSPRRTERDSRPAMMSRCSARLRCAFAAITANASLSVISSTPFMAPAILWRPTRRSTSRLRVGMKFSMSMTTPPWAAARCR